MFVRTSNPRTAGYKLQKEMMVEFRPKDSVYRWYLKRSDLRFALRTKAENISVFVLTPDNLPVTDFPHTFEIRQGITQRHKRYIEIGCKRFVGVNRTRILRWAKA